MLAGVLDNGIVTWAASWTEHESRSTCAFEDVVEWVAREMNNAAVKNLIRIGLATVGSIVEQFWARKPDRTGLERLCPIGLDSVGQRCLSTRL